MKKLLLLFLFVSTGLFAQTPCLDCANADGWYCGDDESNWTQYSPEGCVPTVWLNDGWIDCVDASDENGAEPTTVEYCNEFFPVPCDTIYVDVPIYIYETIFQTDTIYDIEYITQIVIDTVEVEVFVPEYIFVTDTLWMEGALDTMWLNQNGYTSVALLGASFSYAQQNRLKALHPEEIVLCLDNDDAGQKAMSKISTCMKDSCMLSWIELPEQVKDVQEIRQQTLLKQVIDNRVFW